MTDKTNIATWPERIYLQHGCTPDLPTFEEVYANDVVTWCQDQIEELDVAYVRADLAAQPDAKNKRISELESSLQAIFDEMDDDENDSPGHDHRVAGHWDDTGKPCEWCAAWSKAKAVLAGADHA